MNQPQYFLLQHAVVWIACAHEPLLSLLADTLKSHQAVPVFMPIHAQHNQAYIEKALRHLIKKYQRCDAVVYLPSIAAINEEAICHNTQTLLTLARVVSQQLKQAVNPHLLVQCPPHKVIQGSECSTFLLQACAAYALSVATLGLSWQYYKLGVAVNGIWPRHMGNDIITAQAVAGILAKPAVVCSGNFHIDDLTAEAEGIASWNSGFSQQLPLMPFADTGL